MKPRLARASLAIAVLGVLFGVADLVVALRHPGGGALGLAIRSVAYALAGASFVPALGFAFGRNQTQAWSRGKKSAWMMWIVASLPIVVLAGMFALAMLMV